MAKVAGYHGEVRVVSTAAVAGINQWSLDYTVDMLETTDFSASGIASYLPGVSRWSGTFSGFKDGTPIALGVTTTVSVELYESSVTKWVGTAFINGVHPSNNFDGIVQYAYDFTGTGALATSTA